MRLVPSVQRFDPSCPRVGNLFMDNEREPSVETARTGDPVELARLFVTIPSVNPQLEPSGTGEAGLAEVTVDLLAAWGFATEVYEIAAGRPNVVATLPGSGPTLMLNGHLDTVGVEGMSVPPFAAVVESGRLIGRGSCDMKGGLAALMAAAARLAHHGTRPNLIVALTADEEHASLGMDRLVKRGAPMPDLAVVCEPTSLDVMPAHKGFVWVRAVFRGRAAHGSRSDAGIDAIRHAGLYLAALDSYHDDLLSRVEHPLLGHGSFHAGTIRGGAAASVYPDRCEIVLERRTLPEEGPDAVLADFQRALDRLTVREPRVDASLEITLARPGTEVSQGSELVQGLLGAGRDAGLEPQIRGMTAWVDAAYLNEAGVEAVCFGPGSIEQAHTDDEWVDLEEVEVCADVLERFARSLT